MYVFFSLSFSFFFFKQKTAYEMRISDWSSDVCSSDLAHANGGDLVFAPRSLVARAVDPNADPAGAPLALHVEARQGRDDPGFEIEIGRASCRERVCQYV